MSHITFIHGIANKPDSETLLASWLRSLKNSNIGLDIEAEGVTTSMVYWADVLYSNPLSSAEYESLNDGDLEAASKFEVDTIPSSSVSDEFEAKWITNLEKQLGINFVEDNVAGTAPGTMAESLERIPLPWAIKRPFLKAFLRDVHHYLFNSKYSPRSGDEYLVQDEIRGRFIEAVSAVDTDNHVVVSHSLGTLIAYDCLKRVPEATSVDTLITVGSPLGLDEIQDKLKPEWTRNDGFPSNKLTGDWINVFDKLDVVAALDPSLANDFQQDSEEVVMDKLQSNAGLWRHDIKKYLEGQILSETIYRSVGLDF